MQQQSRIDALEHALQLMKMELEILKMDMQYVLRLVDTINSLKDSAHEKADRRPST